MEVSGRFKRLSANRALWGGSEDFVANHCRFVVRRPSKEPKHTGDDSAR